MTKTQTRAIKVVVSSIVVSSIGGKHGQEEE